MTIFLLIHVYTVILAWKMPVFSIGILIANLVCESATESRKAIGETLSKKTQSTTDKQRTN